MEKKHSNKVRGSAKRDPTLQKNSKEKFKICLYENKFSHLTGIPRSSNQDFALVGRFSPYKRFIPLYRDGFTYEVHV